MPHPDPHCIVMDFPKHFDTISKGLPKLCTFKGHRQHRLNYDVYLSLKVV